MSFSDEQLARLDAPLDHSLIHTRKKQGIELVYLEGFEAINQANAIFGYDGWSYVVTRLEQVGTLWYATVRVTVDAGGVRIEREDVGVGLPAAKAGETPSPDAVETAIKSSLTDALKRTLRTWGNAFGNSLYDKDGDVKAQPARAAAAPPAPGAAVTAPTKPVGIGSERAATLEALIEKALTDQGASTADALNWLDAAQRRLQKPHMSDLTNAEGKALLERARVEGPTRLPETTVPVAVNPMDVAPGPDGTWDSIGPDDPQGNDKEARMCANCGAPMIYKEGTKNGREWAAWMCDARCGAKPIWVDLAGSR